MAQFKNQSWYQLLERNAVLKTYASKDIIHFQGRPSEFVSLIISGHVEAVSYSENGDEVWVGGFSSGDFMGHISFLKDVPSQYDLIAKSEVSLFLLPISKMRELIGMDDSLREEFTTDIAKRLNTMTLGLVGAYAMSAKDRICAELMRLSREIGIDPDKYIIRPNPVIVELARRVNSTRETVSRTVSDLQKMGIVSREPGALIIQHPEKLETAFR